MAALAAVWSTTFAASLTVSVTDFERRGEVERGRAAEGAARVRMVEVRRAVVRRKDMVSYGCFV